MLNNVLLLYVGQFSHVDEGPASKAQVASDG